MGELTGRKGSQFAMLNKSVNSSQMKIQLENAKGPSPPPEEKKQEKK